MDQALRARGYHVNHMYNPDDLRVSDQTFAYDAVFVNFVFKGMWGVQSIRSVALTTGSLSAVFTVTIPVSSLPRSIVSPADVQHATELPQRALFCPDSQQAAVQVWFGKPRRAARARSRIWCEPMQDDHPLARRA